MILYLKEDIPSSLLNSGVSIEGFPVELNLRKKKWLCCPYNPYKNQVSEHLKEVGKIILAFSSNYDNLILLDEIKVETTEKHMKDFFLIYSCKNIIRDKTWFKNPEKPKSIFLKMVNTPNFFQNSQAIETGLSNFHKMCLTVLKVFYTKQKPYYSLEIIRNFQMKVLSMISEIYINSSWKNCSFKKFKYI